MKKVNGRQLFGSAEKSAVPYRFHPVRPSVRPSVYFFVRPFIFPFISASLQLIPSYLACAFLGYYKCFHIETTTLATDMSIRLYVCLIIEVF